MKILLVNSIFYPAINWGGPITATYDLARKLAEDGQEVMVYTSDALDYNINMKIERKIRMAEGFEIRYFKNRSRHLKYFFTPGMIISILKNANNFDIIHINSYRQFQDMISFFVLSFLKKPYVITAHGSVRVDGEGKLYKKTYDFFIGKKLLANAKKIIAFRKEQAEDYEKLNVKKDHIKIIPNTIDIEKLPEKGTLRKLLNLSDFEKIILYLGRIDEKKGIGVLIEAFAKIKIENSHLIIAGPDFNFKEKAENMIREFGIEDRVHFVGLLDKKRKYEAFADADIVVYPSLYEAGISMVILEAASVGKPLIISDSIGFSDEAKKFNAALTCKPNNKEDLQEKIEIMLNNLNEAKLMGLRAQKVVKERFSWEFGLKEHISIYKNILKNY
jgi:glycosyltransferase involved in cell wall biosynthesis